MMFIDTTGNKIRLFWVQNLNKGRFEFITFVNI